MKNKYCCLTFILIIILHLTGSSYCQNNNSKTLFKLQVKDGNIVNLINIDSLDQIQLNINKDSKQDSLIIISRGENSEANFDTYGIKIRDRQMSVPKGNTLPQLIEPAETILNQSAETYNDQSDNDPLKQNSSLNIIPPTIQSWQTIMTENFEGTFPSGNWNVFANPGFTDAYWDDNSNRSSGGSWSAWCADAGSESSTPASGYPINMSAWMTYGPFDLSDASEANLIFDYWNISETGFDYFGWYASINGTNYYGSRVSGNSSGWNNITFDLTNVYTLGDITGEPQVWIAFIFTSDIIYNYEGAYVDNVILEKNVSTEPYPDLVPVSMSLSSTTWAVGDQITAGVREDNIGSAIANSHLSQLYLSDNSTISTGDTPLGTPLQYPSIAAGGSNTQNKTFNVPGVSDGTYYVGLIIDINNDVNEINENNNIGVRNGTVDVTTQNYPDLVPVSMSLTTTVWSVGDQITAGVREDNIGSATANSHLSQLYLSDNSTISTSDTPLGTTIQYPSISAGGNNTQNKSFNVPSVSDGTYYVGLIIDINNDVIESNENNNIGVRNGTVDVTTPEPDINVFPTSLTINQTQTGNSNKINVHLDKERLINLSAPYIEGQVVVKFKSEKEFIFRSENNITVCGISEVDQALNELKVYSAEKIYKRSGLPNSMKNTVLLNYSKSLSIQSVVEKLLTLNDIEWVHPDYIYNINDQPNDPYFTNQWYLTKAFSNQAWDLGVGDPNILIGIIDTGVDWDHPDLQNTIWTNPNEIPGNGIDDDSNGYIDDVRGWDWVTNVSDPAPGEDGQTPDNNPMDFNGHGTHCSGIAGATTNNGIGIAGISRGCRIMCLRAGYEASDGNGYVLFSSAASAIDYAIEMGARVISMSFGGGSELLTPVTDAYNNGIVVVHAAGNSNINTASAIDGITQTISVAATDENDLKASFSNYGSWIDVSAPGVNIYSTVFNDTYASYNGTSMSAPLVAGLAALIISQDQSLSPDQITSILINSADNIDNLNPSYSGQLGSGRINAYNALSLISNGNSFTIENIGNDNLSVTDISENVDWLSTAGYPSTPFTISPSGLQSVTVNVNWNLLGGTQQTGTITVYSDDPDEQQVNVNVTAIPTPTQPILSVIPDNRNVSSFTGTTTFDVSNTGTGSMDWTASVTSGNSWLTITDGSPGNNSGTITCSFSSNPNASQRIGTIRVSAPGATGSPKDVTVTQATGSSTEYSISILPKSQTVTGIVNTLIPLEIKIGDPNPVLSPDNFYGVSFNLNWDNTEYVEFSGSYSAGAWLGSNPLTLVQSFSDHIEAGLSRTTGVGVTGNGIVLLCSLKVKDVPPTETTANLTLSNIIATQSDGSSLNLISIGTSTVTITIGTPVWAGDANNDGTVNAVDILPLGLYYNKTGPSREGGSCSWGTYPPGESQLCPPGWLPENAGYADCNGNGTVNAADVLCIGLNYGRTHVTLTNPSTITQEPMSKEGSDIPVLRFNLYDVNNKRITISQLKSDDDFYAVVSISDATGILGISLDVSWKDLNNNPISLKVIEDDKTDGVNLTEVWGAKVISICKSSDEEGKIGIGIVKTDGIALTKQNTELFRIKMKALDTQNLGLTFEKIHGIDENGNAINIRGIPLEKGISQISEIIPSTFQLKNYPNPFNPATRIQIGLPYKSKVNLTIYNSLGQMVTKLVDRTDLEAGVYEYEWFAGNMPSGIYFYQLLTDTYSKTMKMLLIK